ncbi:MAG TPA: hypothetical protein VEG60_22230, partial [Candidatus Binatia bacterium]|nr:hypothetical protein [Candidatus Binatia bacterium]
MSSRSVVTTTNDTASQKESLPSFAESHGCKPVDECEEGILHSLGEGGYASEGFARRSVWRGATGV